MAKDNGAPERLVSHSRMDADYLARRTAMFQNFKMEGYWYIGSGDPKRTDEMRASRRKKARA